MRSSHKKQSVNNARNQYQWLAVMISHETFCSIGLESSCFLWGFCGSCVWSCKDGGASRFFLFFHWNYYKHSIKHTLLISQMSYILWEHGGQCNSSVTKNETLREIDGCWQTQRVWGVSHFRNCENPKCLSSLCWVLCHRVGWKEVNGVSFF